MKRHSLLKLLLLLPMLSLGLMACDVLQHHLHGTRDGLYVDPLITQAASTRTRRDTTFSALLPGPTYAQPLYVTRGPGGRAAFFVVTEQIVVAALDAANGASFRVRILGRPVPRFLL